MFAETLDDTQQVRRLRLVGEPRAEPARGIEPTLTMSRMVASLQLLLAARRAARLEQLAPTPLSPRKA